MGGLPLGRDDLRYSGKLRPRSGTRHPCVGLLVDPEKATCPSGLQRATQGSSDTRQNWAWMRGLNTL